MPHICPIIPHGSNQAIDLLIGYKVGLRRVVAEAYGYEFDQVAVIPRILTALETNLGSNLLPLEIVIDLGSLPNIKLDDTSSDALMTKVLERCPALADIRFGIWIREMSSNGFSEHNPVKEKVGGHPQG